MPRRRSSVIPHHNSIMGCFSTSAGEFRRIRIWECGGFAGLRGRILLRRRNFCKNGISLWRLPKKRCRKMPEFPLPKAFPLQIPRRRNLCLLEERSLPLPRKYLPPKGPRPPLRRRILFSGEKLFSSPRNILEVWRFSKKPTRGEAVKRHSISARPMWKVRAWSRISARQPSGSSWEAKEITIIPRPCSTT